MKENMSEKNDSFRQTVLAFPAPPGMGESAEMLDAGIEGIGGRNTMRSFSRVGNGTGPGLGEGKRGGSGGGNREGREKERERERDQSIGRKSVASRKTMLIYDTEFPERPPMVGVVEMQEDFGEEREERDGKRGGEDERAGSRIGSAL